MNYEIVLSPKAARHLDEWKKSGQEKSIQKILKIFDELREHPMSGTGQVEKLKGDYTGYWSRRIDKQSRMVYRIEEDRIVVMVISLRGLYDDV